MLILHNVATMSKTLGELMHRGYSIDDEILANLSPFPRGHINRFGSYVMNMEREIEPMEYTIPRPS